MLFKAKKNKTAIKIFLHQGNQDWTPLHTAVQTGNLDIVKYFTELIFSEDTCLLTYYLKQKMLDGSTVFYIAAYNGRLSIIEYFVKMICNVKTIKAEDTSIKLHFQGKDISRRTPLFIAVEKDYIDIVKYIVESIFFTDMNNSSVLKLCSEQTAVDNVTIFHIAAGRERLNIIEYFTKENASDSTVMK